MTEKAVDSLNLREGAFADPEPEETAEGSAEDLASFGVQVRKSTRGTPVYRSGAG